MSVVYFDAGCNSDLHIALTLFTKVIKLVKIRLSPLTQVHLELGCYIVYCDCVCHLYLGLTTAAIFHTMTAVIQLSEMLYTLAWGLVHVVTWICVCL